MSDPLPIGRLDTPAFEILDAAFAPLVNTAEHATRLWTGGTWVEGPAWLPREKLLVWSDIPANRMLSRHEPDGAITTYRSPAAGANGNTTDREGRLVTCEQFTRRIARTEPNGSITVLVDRFEGKRFNAPNDIVVKSDGTVWFTDPDYGRSPLYEGERELGGCHVYRLDPSTGSIQQMTNDMVMPNGLAFSPDESILYVIDTGSTHIKGGPNHVRQFEVATDGKLTGGRVLATNAAEKFDGLRIDALGNLWMGAEDGVHIYSAGGLAIGKICLPERVSNLTFGGRTRDTLMMTGTSSIYSCPVMVRPAAK